MTESKFKGLVFVFIFLLKGMAILFLLFSWSTGGFSTEELASAFTQVLPLFTVYTYVIFQDIMKNKYVLKEKKKQKELPKSTVAIYIAFLSGYGLSILYLIYLKVAGDFSFAQMGASLSGLESLMGIFIGKIIYSFFPKEEKEK